MRRRSSLDCQVHTGDCWGRSVRFMMEFVDLPVTIDFGRCQATVWCMRWVARENEAGGEGSVERRRGGKEKGRRKEEGGEKGGGEEGRRGGGEEGRRGGGEKGRRGGGEEGRREGREEGRRAYIVCEAIMRLYRAQISSEKVYKPCKTYYADNRGGEGEN